MRRSASVVERDFDNLGSIASSERREEVVRIEKKVSGRTRSFVQLISQSKVEQVSWRIMTDSLLHEANYSLNAVGDRKNFEVGNDVLGVEEQLCILRNLGSSKKAKCSVPASYSKARFNVRFIPS